eukprot:161284-Amphidinium_carterae.1
MSSIASTDSPSTSMGMPSFSELCHGPSFTLTTCVVSAAASPALTHSEKELEELRPQRQPAAGRKDPIDDN